MDTDEYLKYYPLSIRSASVAKDFLDHGGNIDEKDGTGSTALIWAAFRGDVESTRLLIERGAALDETDMFGHTALFWAEYHRDHDIVQMLKDAPKMRKKAEKEQKRQEKIKNSSKAAAVYNADTLSAAIAAGDCEKVRTVFDDAFWQNKPVSFGWEHLKIALEHEDRPMLRLLITWGAADHISDLSNVPVHQTELLRQCGLRKAPVIIEVPKPVPPRKQDLKSHYYNQAIKKSLKNAEHQNNKYSYNNKKYLPGIGIG